MAKFIQLHLLTFYPPSNLNRDDLGRPKTARVGGIERLRISSQCIKRAWRASDLFKEAMAGFVGTRTKKLGKDVYKKLIELGMKEKSATDCAKKIAAQFGKLKAVKDDKKAKKEGEEKAKKVDKYPKGLEVDALVHISSDELKAVYDLVEVLAKDNREPKEEELSFLRKDIHSADIALFGRMLASSPEFNVEAAAQVAHPITVNQVVVEDDFFTAVDDINLEDDETLSGSAHLGDRGFGSGVFYLYICINRDLLVKNLQGDENLAEKCLKSLAACTCQIAPGGMQNSYGSRAYTSYALAEKGSNQPRSLAVAFVNPVKGPDMVSEAVTRIEETLKKMDTVYKNPETRYSFDVEKQAGIFETFCDFVAE